MCVVCYSTETSKSEHDLQHDLCEEKERESLEFWIGNFCDVMRTIFYITNFLMERRRRL